MRKKAMTLIELLLTLILVSGIILLVSASSIFFVNQLQANLERSNIHSQINYAMDDMKIRCVSAISLEPSFNFNGEEKTELIFQGESDIYKVTLNDLTDNRWYKYYISNTDLVVKSCTDSSCNSGSEEILIEGKFKPGVTFNYDQGTPVNLLRVELTAEGSKIPLGGTKEITKEGGIRFWFIDAAK
jgi:hypothetical protein